MLLIGIESVEEIKSSEIALRDQNQLIMPPTSFYFQFCIYFLKIFFSTASTQLQEKDVQHFLLTNNF